MLSNTPDNRRKDQGNEEKGMAAKEEDIGRDQEKEEKGLKEAVMNAEARI